ncbi:MAG TPA: neutral zinc metallopeptidase [Bacteroidales bacterium]|nr:neutral zinc metallopeptidase [Bacteroidales bacterium]HQI70277.1 neutral zinc metallopeptidase [Bacteroidales bacterium]
MKWSGRRQSDNVEDRRSISGKGIAGIGGIGAIIIAVIAFFITKDPSQLLDTLQQSGVQQEQLSAEDQAHQDSLASFISVVLADTEDVWAKLFNEMGKTYQMPKLVMFTGAVQSACGQAQSAVGPFYCSGDSRVYLDLDFLEQLQQKLGAQGDFAQAYIVAHEVGHHVQNLLGTLDEVHGMSARLSEKEYNEMTVRLELQADFYAGVWAHHAQKMKNIMEKGDIDEAVNAAGAVGDDKIQMENQGYVVPDSFTHGTSAQRVKWFKLGFTTGDITKSDTFNARVL